MEVVQLFRYPVKSLRGESAAQLDLGSAGAAGDRRFGIFDVSSQTVVSAKRDGRLLFASARLEAAIPLVAIPGAAEHPPGPELDGALSDWLGRPVRLVASADHGPGTFECPVDFESDDSEPVRWRGPAYSFVDSAAVHLLSLATLAALRAERPELDWSLPRFRPNVVLAGAGPGFVERSWIGKEVRLGPVRLQIDKQCTRCVMTTRAQPGGHERQLDVLRHLSAVHDAAVGVLAHVVEPGVLKVGDAVVLD